MADLLRMARAGALNVAKAGAEAASRIEGYFYNFGTLSEPIWDCYKWEIAPGAGKESLARNDQKVLFDHSTMHVFGSVDAGTAHLAEDSTGCRGWVDPVDAQWARDAVASVKRGDINSASFGFSISDSHWRQADGWDIEVLDKLDVVEVSVVTFPRFRSTVGQIRASLPVEVGQENLSLVTRAINRAHHKLEMVEEDRAALREYGSLLVASDRLPVAYRQSLASAISPAPFTVSLQTWAEEVKNLALGG